MGGILRNWRVLGAALVAMTVIGGSYLIARGINDPSMAEASAETALLQAAAAKDSTGDGLPDWQKVLYGIPLDATTTDYFHLGMTDGEAVARGLIVPKATAPDAASADSTGQGTLTAAFGKAFFSLYVSAKQANGGAELTADQTTALANEALSQFVEHFAPAAAFKEASDLKAGGTGPDALAAFAAAAEGIFNRYGSDAPVSEIQVMQNALQNNDPQATASLASLAKIYRGYAAGFAAVSVPAELANADLVLVNAFAQRASIYEGLSRASVDPLMAIVSLQQVLQNESSWRKALSDMHAVYTAAGVGIPDGAPGVQFLRIIANVSAAKP